MKRIIIILVSVLLTTGTQAGQKQKVIVKKIVDGDTIKIMYYGKKRNCRLIGIDTPESKNNNKARKNAKKTGQNIKDIIRQGKEATFYLQSILERDKYIYIVVGKQKYDKYGRLLIYAYQLNHRMINKMIIKKGFAVPMPIWPCVKYKKEFQAAYEWAVKNKKGLWR